MLDLPLAVNRRHPKSTSKLHLHLGSLFKQPTWIYESIPATLDVRAVLYIPRHEYLTIYTLSKWFLNINSKSKMIALHEPRKENKP